jgi:hypothetical protein
MPVREDDHLPAATNEQRVAELVARLGCAYGKYGLSPPFDLKSAAEAWLRQSISPDEIVGILDDHMYRCRQDYRGGAGASLFRVFLADIGKALEARRPAIDRPPARPQRPRSRARTLHNPSGFPDVYVEGEAARTRIESGHP